jgi:hypothetical protein
LCSPTPLLRCCYSVYLICIVTLTIHSFNYTYYLNWPDQPVLPHSGYPDYLHCVPPPTPPLRYCYSLFIIYA